MEQVRISVPFPALHLKTYPLQWHPVQGERGGSGGWLRVKGLAQHEQSHPSSQSEHPATADRQVTVTPASIYCHAVLFALEPRGHDVCDLLLKGKIV